MDKIYGILGKSWKFVSAGPAGKTNPVMGETGKYTLYQRKEKMEERERGREVKS